jgi:hypothetical protein
MEGGAVGHNFEMGLPKDYPSQIWFNLVQRFQRRFECVNQIKSDLAGIVLGLNITTISKLCPTAPLSIQDGCCY